MDRTYFLGANSANGFYSCYDSFCRPEDGGFLYIIKSGPGSGKSTMMRRIAQAARTMDLSSETVLCSGDPDSLDGVYLPALGVGVVDGTAPHIIEPRVMGAADVYLDLSGCYDLRKAMAGKERLMRLFQAYRSRYGKAYALLSELSPPEPPQMIPANVKRRLTLAVSCQGILRLPFPTEPVRISRDQLREQLPHSGASVVYLHPLWPNLAEAYETPDGRLFSSEIPMPDCAAAVEALAEAKNLHDELEAAYRPCVNFSAVEEKTEETIRRIFQKQD